ncbi:hypothetical protein BJX99DRAFT_33424 [Aspergillus californicus]
MAALPPEIWCQVCLHLEKRELSALSRASRQYHEIVSPFLYRSLRIQFRDPETLQKAVNKIFDRSGHLFLRYARTLDIVCLQPLWPGTEKSRYLWGLKDWGMEYVDWEEPATITNVFLEPQLRSPTGVRGLVFPVNGLGTYQPSNWVRDWAPVTELIGRLNRLEQFNFVADRTPFGSMLLEAITQHHPACCVNVWSLQDVENSRRTPTERDQVRFDFNALQSKHTRTLAVTLKRKISDEHGYEDVDEILPFLFVAPNLKHLILSIRGGPRSGIEQLKREWENAARMMQPTPVAELESLTVLDFQSPMYLFPKLASLIDLGRLRSLDIPIGKDTSLFLDFAPDLTGLERLFVGVSPLRPSDQWPINIFTDNYEIISAVIAVKPLKYLCMRGLRETSSLHRIAAHHGPTLCGLSLEPYHPDHSSGAAFGSYRYPELTPSDLKLLATSCPNLVELCLQLRRSEGNTYECDIYRALGDLSKLHTLILGLHYDPRQRGVAPDRMGRMYPNQIAMQNGDDGAVDAALFRTTLINAAIDETLAMGIWDLIASSQPSACLRNLRILPFGHEMYPMDESYYLIFLARSFLVTRLGTENPAVEEIGKMAWKVWQEDNWGPGGPSILPHGADEVIAGIWPDLVGRDDWSTGWASLPLETGIS